MVESWAARVLGKPFKMITAEITETGDYELAKSKLAS